MNELPSIVLYLLLGCAVVFTAVNLMHYYHDHVAGGHKEG
jgi:hypothetical protein